MFDAVLVVGCVALLVEIVLLTWRRRPFVKSRSPTPRGLTIMFVLSGINVVVAAVLLFTIPVEMYWIPAGMIILANLTRFMLFPP